jgi:hypothetical protein
MYRSENTKRARKTIRNVEMRRNRSAFVRHLEEYVGVV